MHHLKPADISHLYDTDETLPSPALRHGSVKVKRLAEAAVAAEPVVGEVSGAEVRVSEGEEDKENISAVPVEKKPRQEVSVLVGLICTMSSRAYRKRKGHATRLL